MVNACGAVQLLVVAVVRVLTLEFYGLVNDHPEPILPGIQDPYS